MADVAPVEPVAIPPPPKPEDYGITFATPKPPLPGEPSLAPMTERAAASTVGIRVKGPSFEERNINVFGETVPIDRDVGVPTWTYFQTKLNRLKEDQLNYLRSVYGAANVALGDTGEPIIRVVDSETGKSRAITLAPERMSFRDVADLGAHGLEIAGGFMAAKKGDVRGMWQNVVNIARMSVGAEAGGALQDAVVRGTQPGQGGDVRPGEILAYRATMVPLDFGAGLFMAAGGKVLGKAISPFSDPMPAQFDLTEAKARLRAKYPGLELPNTPGELTGSSILLRTEQFGRQQTGAAGVFQKIVDKQDADVRTVQDILLGKSTATTEEAGEMALEAIGSKTIPLRSEIEGLKKGVRASATAELKGAATTATGLTDAPDRQIIGEALRGAAHAARESWKKSTGYDEFFSNPITQQENISVKSLSDRAKGILASMPSTEKITKVPTGVTDAAGNPILKDEVGREVWKEFIPERVLARLQRIATSPDAKLSLNQLKQMRTEVDDDILTGEAVPGVRNVHLKRIRSMLTDAMSEAVESFGDPKITAEWKRINKSYAENVPRFEQKGIAEFFRDPQNPNWEGNTRLVRKAIDDPDIYKEYVKFFGEHTPALDALRRSIADEVIEANPVSNMVDGKTFVTNLKNLINKSPQMAKDVFGEGISRLFSVASAETAGSLGERDRAGMLIRNINGKVDLGDLTELLRSGSPTAQKLVDLVSAQNKLALEYRNSLKKAAAEGGPLGEKIQPTEFVNSFSRQGEPKDIKEIMSLLADRPDVTENIRRQALLDIFARARASSETLKHQFGKPGELSASGLEEALGLAGRGGPTQQQRYRAILGDDTWQDLVDLGRFLTPREGGAATFGTAGRLSMGSKIAQLERGGALSFLDSAARSFVLATAYASPMIRKWIGNVAFTPKEQNAIMNYLVASTPFVEALIKEYGVEPGKRNAMEIAARIKAGIDQSVRRDERTQSPAIDIPQPLSMDYFKPSTNQPAKK